MCCYFIVILWAVLLFQLDVVGENYISPESLDKPLPQTHIEAMGFDQRGDWLVTCERLETRKTSTQIKLKFWAYHTESNQ